MTVFKKFYLVHFWMICPIYQIGFHNDIFLMWTLNGVTRMKIWIFLKKIPIITDEIFIWIFLFIVRVLLYQNIVFFFFVFFQTFCFNLQLDLDSRCDCVSNYNSPSLQENLIFNFPFLWKIVCVFPWNLH